MDNLELAESFLEEEGIKDSQWQRECPYNKYNEEKILGKLLEGKISFLADSLIPISTPDCHPTHLISFDLCCIFYGGFTTVITIVTVSRLQNKTHVLRL